MTDLVERLRKEPFGPGPLLGEAATEIERLQAENERLNKQISKMNHAAHAYDGCLEELVKRQELLEKVVEAATALDEYDDYYVHAPAEIVLNKALEKALAALKDQATPESTEPVQQGDNNG